MRMLTKLLWVAGFAALGIFLYLKVDKVSTFVNKLIGKDK